MHGSSATNRWGFFDFQVDMMGAISVTAISGVGYLNILLTARWRPGTVGDCRVRRIFGTRQTLAIQPSLRWQDGKYSFSAIPSFQPWCQMALPSTAVGRDSSVHCILIHVDLSCHSQVTMCWLGISLAGLQPPLASPAQMSRRRARHWYSALRSGFGSRHGVFLLSLLYISL